MKIVGKISMKTVIGSIPTVDAKQPKMKDGVVVMDGDKVVMETVQRGIKQDLMRVFGQCDKIKLGNTTFGETVEFQGTFEAINILTGEIYRGSRLFLPPVLTDMVRAEVVAAGDTGVQFAFDIGVDSANTPHGYQYTITPLSAPSTTDPLAMMKTALLANAPPLPQIAAPSKAEEKRDAEFSGNEVKAHDAKEVETVGANANQHHGKKK